MGYEFDYYLGEFEFLFKINLGYESGTRWVLMMKKTKGEIPHASVPVIDTAVPDCYWIKYIL
jgi:hypothetical protein